MTSSETHRICLWSGPRNVSTALMYSFAQRPDTQVFDEPLYGHYLKVQKNRPEHPLEEEIMTQMETDGQKVVQMILGAHAKPVVFFKNMTHHLVDLNTDFLEHTDHIILTRDPAEMIPSYAKIIPNPSPRDLGYEASLKLLTQLLDLGKKPVILDAKKLLLNPSGVLNQLCERLNLTFYPAMLFWPSGPRKEDGIWASYWYAKLHESKGFSPYVKSKNPFPKSLVALHEKSQIIYSKLVDLALS